MIPIYRYPTIRGDIGRDIKSKGHTNHLFGTNMLSKTVITRTCSIQHTIRYYKIWTCKSLITDIKERYYIRDILSVQHLLLLELELDLLNIEKSNFNLLMMLHSQIAISTYTVYRNICIYLPGNKNWAVLMDLEWKTSLMFFFFISTVTYHDAVLWYPAMEAIVKPKTNLDGLKID